MFHCFSNQRHPPNLQSKQLIVCFQIIMGFELFFSFYGIFIGNLMGIYYLLKVMVIHCSYHSLDPFYCVVYECMNFMTIYVDIASLGLIFQNSWPICSGDDYIDQSNLLYLLNLIFGLIVLYPVFLGYREFKGCQMERANDRLSDGGASLSNPSVDYQMNSVNNQENEDHPLQNQPQEPLNNNNINNPNNLNDSRVNIIPHNYHEEEKKEDERPNDGQVREENNREINKMENQDKNIIGKNQENNESLERSNINNSNRLILNNNGSEGLERSNINNGRGSDINNNASFQAFAGRGVLIGSSG